MRAYRFVGLSLGLVAVGSVDGCSSDGHTARGIAATCTISSDCAVPLVCAFQRCHQQCASSRDCERDAVCVSSNGAGVCQLTEESTCTKDAECSPGLLCASGSCRSGCHDDTACLASQRCTDTVCEDVLTDAGVSGNGGAKGTGGSATGGGQASGGREGTVDAGPDAMIAPHGGGAAGASSMSDAASDASSRSDAGEAIDGGFHCPDPDGLPPGDVYSPYVIHAATLVSEPVVSWTWAVHGNACDDMFYAGGHDTTFTVGGAATANVSLTTTLPGTYTATAHLTFFDTSERDCSFHVRMRQKGLRVALCWDQTGSGGADLDLHLHRPGTTTSWFTRASTGTTPNPDDCHYANCKAGTVAPADFGLAASPVASCVGSPDYALWQTAAACRNPRLESENIITVGRPELIAVDEPTTDAPLRAMVHYYGGTVTTHPVVLVYCDGTLAATLGTSALGYPDVPGFVSGGGFGAGPMWRAADITPHVTAGALTCDVAPLHPPGQLDGYNVTTGSSREY